MLHACEGPSSVIDHSAPQSCLDGVEDAQGVVKGQGGYEAFIWQVAYVGDCPVMDSAAGRTLLTIIINNNNNDINYNNNYY